MAANNNRMKKLNRIPNLPTSVRIAEIIFHDDYDESLVICDPPIHRICPYCGANECYIKDSGYLQTLRHTPAHDHVTVVTFHKQRLYCKTCQATFMENPDWIHPSLRMTLPLYYKLCESLMTTSSLRSIAAMLNVSVTIVEHVLDSISFDRPDHLPKILCIDEFKGDSGEWDDQQKCWHGNRYHCNIVNGDGDKGFVMDILPQISAIYIKAYFRHSTR